MKSKQRSDSGKKQVYTVVKEIIFQGDRVSNGTIEIEPFRAESLVASGHLKAKAGDEHGR